MRLTKKKAQKMMEAHGGNLCLSNTNYTELPENLVVKGDLRLDDSCIREFPCNMTVKGSVSMKNSSITEIPDGLIIHGTLDLKHSKVVKLPDGFFVGGCLLLNSSILTELPRNLTVLGYMMLNDYIEHLPEGLVVGSDISLWENNKIETIPEDIVVGGSIHLNKYIKHLPDYLVIGGSVIVDNMDFTDLPDHLVVGGHLDIVKSGIRFLPEGVKVNSFIICKNGVYMRSNHPGNFLDDHEYVPGRYLYTDNRVTPIEQKEQIGDYDYYIGKIPGRNVVSDGEYFAHCKDIDEGICELKYKHTAERGLEQYYGLSLDSTLPVEEMITMYRIITGEGRQEIEDFMDPLGSLKESYSVKEMIDLADGHYRSLAFRKFFC